jgi:hypothetical protein
MIWNVLPLLLALSLFGNFLLIWYLRQILGRFAYICTNIFELKAMVDLYMKHLEVVSELEMFFKDPHMAQLLKHTEDLVVQLHSYEEFYELLETKDMSNIPDILKGKDSNEEPRTIEDQKAEEASSTIQEEI